MRANTSEDIFRFIDKTEGGCWIWTGFCIGGSPHWSWRQKTKNVARLLWEQEHGPLPRHSKSFRSCGNRRCVNPEHIRFPVHEKFIKPSVVYRKPKQYGGTLGPDPSPATAEE